MAKSAPFSIRLSPRLAVLIRDEATRTRRSRGAVIEALADEALRCRRFVGIAFRGPNNDRRAWLMGTALDVWQVIEAHQDFADADRMVAETDITARQLRVALAYYREYPEEIDAAIWENRRPIEAFRDDYPLADFTAV